jgi:hypothetical protein
MVGELLAGRASEAYVEAIRRNVGDGLPLSLSEGRAATERIIEVSGGWSDRRIAEASRLAPSSMSRLRRAGTWSACPSGWIEQLDARVGPDGRRRPVSDPASREAIVATGRAHPEAPLRTPAALVGLSPETVRRVRLALDGEVGACDRWTEVPGPRPSGAAAPSSWQTDRALTSCAGGDDLATWLSSTTAPPEYRGLVADQCRRRARFWEKFATGLEGRSRPASRSGDGGTGVGR